jgi:hypothetical protein
MRFLQFCSELADFLPSFGSVHGDEAPTTTTFRALLLTRCYYSLVEDPDLESFDHLPAQDREVWEPYWMPNPPNPSIHKPFAEDREGRTRIGCTLPINQSTTISNLCASISHLSIDGTP